MYHIHIFNIIQQTLYSRHTFYNDWNSNEYNLIFFVISGIGYFEFDWSIHAGDKSTQEAAKRQNEFATIPLTVIG